MCVSCGCGANTISYAPVKRKQAAKTLPSGNSETARKISLEASVLGANAIFAKQNRATFAAQNVTAYNLVSSPGSGKTTLLCATITALNRRQPELLLAVIEGDQQTCLDADRIRLTGAPVVQINTGHGCHLDAQMVGQAYAQLPSPSLLFIENVGNLVCPALWDIGEAAKVVILSVTEGEDKPLKYPDMFAAASLMVVNKIDLLPYVNFDMAKCIGYARRINPGIVVLELSATRGDGMEAWLDCLLQPVTRLQAPAR